MRIVIHQAYFMPWLGYFSKLAFCDGLVVLDDVEFSKRHYLDRTKIISTQGVPLWLSLPLGENYKHPCNTVLLPSMEYVPALVRTIVDSYAKARFKSSCIEKLCTILFDELHTGRDLASANLAMILRILDLIQLEPPNILYSSDFQPAVSASERLMNIIQNTGANVIVLGSGKSMDVHDWKRIIVTTGVRVEVQDYFTVHPQYYQTRRSKSGFVPGLSIVDALLNVGLTTTRSFLTSDTYKPIPIINDNM